MRVTRENSQGKGIVDRNLLSSNRVVEIREGQVGWSDIDPVGKLADEHLLRLVIGDGGGEHLPVSCGVKC